MIGDSDLPDIVVVVTSDEPSKTNFGMHVLAMDDPQV
jgi:hypothetical protein